MKKMFLYYEGRAMDKYVSHYNNIIMSKYYNYILPPNHYKCNAHTNLKEYILLQHDMKRK